MKNLIKKLLQKLFGKLLRKKEQPQPIYEDWESEPGLSDEDWSGNDYIIDKPKSSKRTIIRTRGKAHNLKKIFNRLNKEHFGGKIEAKITWGRYGARNVQRMTSIVFGTYSPSELLIRIQPALDCKEVPEIFVEHVIHHEMLHEVLPPVMGSGSKWIIHHHEFREAEAETPSYKEAIQWQRNNIKMFIGIKAER